MGMAGAVTTDEVVPEFRGRIRRQRAGPVYQLGLVLVALCMAILPALYLALIGAVAWFVYRSTASLIFPETRITWKLRIYGTIALLTVGGTVIFFLIKPLLARPPRPPRPFAIDRDSQPVFFAFVDRLCAIVGAARPGRIDLDTDANASASFRKGLFSRDLVLTVGLPLVDGLTVRQLGGVLAHEFGHFSQGLGMRLSYVIRSINGWFARVVYERDSWDEGLQGWVERSGDLRVTLLGLVAQFGVGASRAILSGLMRVGHAVSCFALRQMEYDADGYETQVAGADAFEAVAGLLPVLGAGTELAFHDLSQAWAERKLVDDLPGHIRARTAMIPGDGRQEIRKEAFARRTRIFDTHPSMRDRVAAARRLGSEGILHDDRGASALFRGYPELCRELTRHVYAQQLGREARGATLIDTAALVGSRESEAKALAAFRRFFGDGFDVDVAAIGAEARAAEGSAAAVAAAVRDLRARGIATDPSLRRELEVQENRLGRKASALAIWQAGRRLDMSAWGLDATATIEDLKAHIADAVKEWQEVRERCRDTVAPSLERIELALGVLARDDLRGLVPEGAGAHRSALRHAATLRALQKAQGPRDRVALSFARVVEIARRTQSDDDKRIAKALRHSARPLRADLRALRQAIEGAPHPEKEETLETLLVPEPIPYMLESLHEAAGSALQQLFQLRARSLGHLAQVALQVEEALLDGPRDERSPLPPSQ